MYTSDSYSGSCSSNDRVYILVIGIGMYVVVVVIRHICTALQTKLDFLV